MPNGTTYSLELVTEPERLVATDRANLNSFPSVPNWPTLMVSMLVAPQRSYASRSSGQEVAVRACVCDPPKWALCHPAHYSVQITEPRHTGFPFIFYCTHLFRSLLTLLHDRQHSILKLLESNNRKHSQLFKDERTNVFLTTIDIFGLVVMVLDIDSAIFLRMVAFSILCRT